MIRFFLIQNRVGRTRLSKWYISMTSEEKRKLETEIHRLLTSRNAKFTNFIEFRNYKIIYRRYAGLYFTFCVDTDDNELAMYEAIHLFVETLDDFFGQVTELHLVYNFHQVYCICDEVFLGGQIAETGKKVILSQMASLKI
eukprot:gnl/Dysnectes_brevis/2962_a3643_1963.p1 GENE.gnl/Dysnectes_brevis/2962_a3643_1963~~gnl/Dysnectes_brevis/2962_a3643_1963.p1  ORF type:complete len:141 (+),score=11.82 gnl/Dysnectes_brevis/2962_a3643_1963:36-458(+)